VLGRSHRQGQLHLLLVLPDGSRSLIPASWTDLEMVPDKVPAAMTGLQAPIASLSQLLHTLRIVDALQRRREASKEGGSHCGGGGMQGWSN
jgi:hypothetical protein